MTPTFRFIKIKYAGDPITMTLQYERRRGAGWDKHTLETRQSPHPDFVKALAGLNHHLQDMAEQYTISGELAVCDVKSVSFSHTNGVLGVVISGARTLRDSNQPLNINSPHKTYESYSDYEDKKQLLSAECIIAVDILMGAALNFIDGKRAQSNMFVTKDEGLVGL